MPEWGEVLQSVGVDWFVTQGFANISVAEITGYYKTTKADHSAFV
jgi:hypothetical protein